MDVKELKTAAELTDLQEKMRYLALKGIQHSLFKIREKCRELEMDDDGNVGLPEPIFHAAVDDQASEMIVEIHTNTKVLGIDYLGEISELPLEQLSTDKLILILGGLEELLADPSKIDIV